MSFMCTLTSSERTLFLGSWHAWVWDFNCALACRTLVHKKHCAFRCGLSNFIHREVFSRSLRRLGYRTSLFFVLLPFPILWPCYAAKMLCYKTGWVRSNKNQWLTKSPSAFTHEHSLPLGCLVGITLNRPRDKTRE